MPVRKPRSLRDAIVQLQRLEAEAALLGQLVDHTRTLASKKRGDPVKAVREDLKTLYDKRKAAITALQTVKVVHAPRK